MNNSYCNPLSIQGIGDPYILKSSGGKYYCYPTSDPGGFRVWSSDNLTDWQDEGFVYRKDEQSWAYKHFWAPEVMEYNGKFYMYYTARWKANDSLRIGAAVADRPTGPFKDMIPGPMFDFGYAVIDAHVFIDDDGKKYMYYSRDCSENVIDGRHESHIYAIELDDDMLTLKGEPVLLAKPEQEWELRSGPEWFWNEGAFVLKRAGLYYLMYSANCYAGKHYSVGYAVSEHPLGPYVKYADNPVLASLDERISGPGHHSVVLSPDGTEWFIAYHTHTDPVKGGGNRQLCIDRLIFREDGSIKVLGPTITPQKAPS